MKNIPYIIIAAFAILLTSACQKNELHEEDKPGYGKHLKTLAVGVEEETETRVGFGEDLAFYWNRGDKIGVLTSAGFKEMTLDESYGGRGMGMFVGDFEEEMGGWIVYPFGAHMMAGEQLTYVLPSSYTYVYPLFSTVKETKSKLSTATLHNVDSVLTICSLRSA